MRNRSFSPRRRKPRLTEMEGTKNQPKGLSFRVVVSAVPSDLSPLVFVGKISRCF
ncbi:hypothetical protein HAT2_00328 [Candidatus Similichlamydia laticola]|uniref:Uncharacterized protein n=1 Tax=Candidatus Similichlamydia laticola TaxID=2170265 RepID=A0A369KFT5_9BACT|nr:hypothetical protein HAT2_00328 [Candidatus Similichlamydia laticola]